MQNNDKIITDASRPDSPLNPNYNVNVALNHVYVVLNYIQQNRDDLERGAKTAVENLVTLTSTTEGLEVALNKPEASRSLGAAYRVISVLLDAVRHLEALPLLSQRQPTATGGTGDATALDSASGSPGPETAPPPDSYRGEGFELRISEEGEDKCN